VNAGIINGNATNTSGAGIVFNDNFGASVTNQSGASISGYEGIEANISGAATVVNGGIIAGNTTSSSGVGILLGHGGTVINQGGATIGGFVGFRGYAPLGYPVTLLNAGTINGSNDAVQFGVGSVGDPFDSAPVTFRNTGTVDGKNDAVSFEAGRTNLLIIDPGAVFIGAVQGGNTMGATSVSTLELASGASAGALEGVGTQFVNFGSIEFDPGAAWFVSGDTAGLAGTISGFASSDTIELTGVTATGSAYSSGVLTIDESGGSATLTLPGSFVTSDFMVSNVAAGVEVALNTPCFVRGTRIRTDRGETPVEALTVGDHVRTMSGDAKPVLWLGHRAVDCRRHPDPEQVWPIHVNAGAFGPARPCRDLYLSPDHAVFSGGVLIPVRYLVNGRTITQQPHEAVEYWHVELARHSVIYANGLPTESYLDTGNRGAFANGGPVLDIHPEFARRVWDRRSFAPLVLNGPRLAAARRRILACAATMGHGVTHDPDLQVIATGRSLHVERIGDVWCVTLPEAATTARIVSRVWQPAHMRPTSNDTRSLGVAIARLWLDGREVRLNGPRLPDGWHTPEPRWRWTNGDASVAVNHARRLKFQVVMNGTYWVGRDHDQVRAA
jgi:hypothetical protein